MWIRVFITAIGAAVTGAVIFAICKILLLHIVICVCLTFFASVFVLGFVAYCIMNKEAEERTKQKQMEVLGDVEKHKHTNQLKYLMHESAMRNRSLWQRLFNIQGHTAKTSDGIKYLKSD